MTKIIRAGHAVLEHPPESGCMILAPNTRVDVPHGARIHSLHGLATQSVQAVGFRPVSPIQAILTMRRLLAEDRGYDPTGSARQALATVDALFRAGLEPPHLEQVQSERAAYWCRIALRLREILHGDNMVLPSDTIRLALQHPVDRHPFWIIGYPRLNRLEARWINHCTDENATLVFPTGDIALFAENRTTIDWLVEKGWNVEPQRSCMTSVGTRIAHQWGIGAQPSMSAVRVEQAPSQHSEIRAALAQVKRWLARGVPLHRMVLVVRNESRYGPALKQVGHEYGVPVRLFHKISLHQTRLGLWITALTAMVTSAFRNRETRTFLMHPVSSGLLDDSMKRVLRGSAASGLEEWCGVVPVLARLVPPERATPNEWLSWLDEAMRITRVEQNLKDSAWELQALRVWQEGGLEWAGCVQDKPSAAQAIWRDWQDLLGILSVPAAPGRGGIAVHTPLSLYGNRFTHAVVLGMVEGETPPVLNDDPILDEFIRNHLHQAGIPIERNWERSQREALSFWTMLHSFEEEILFTLPQRIGIRETLPSSYLKALSLGGAIRQPSRVVCSSIERRRIELLRSGTEPDPVLERARYSHSVESQRESDTLFSSHDGLSGFMGDIDACRFSPSQLTQFGQCPFRWFATHGLRLYEDEIFEPELNAAHRGSLMHTVLQRLVEETRDSEIIREHMLERLEPVLDEVAGEPRFQRKHAWSAHRTEMIQLLRIAIQSDDFVRPGDVPVRLEHEVKGEWRGLKVRGLVDRVDQGPDGLRIMDYKTASQRPMGAINTEGKPKLDIQMKVYAALIAKEFQVSAWEIDSVYFLIPKGSATPPEGASQEEYVAFVSNVHEAIEQGKFPVQPDAEQKVCTYCPHESVCRRGPRLRRKQGEPCN